MNAVERLQSAFSIDGANRFYIVYGIGVEDSYTGFDYSEMTVEQALLQSLQQQSYRRVAFIAPHKPVYYLDQYSEVNCSPTRKVAEARPAYQPASLQTFSGGPLNNRFLYKTNPVQPQQNGFSGMGDLHSIRMLDALMREQKAERTAVVFMQAETLLRYFGDLRTLAGLLGEWERLPSENRNVAVFVFSAGRYDDLCQIAQQLPVPEIRNRILRRAQNPGQPDGLVNLRGPEEMEILRLLRRSQQTRRIPVVENELLQISQWMAAEGLKHRHWQASLEGVNQISIEALRKMGWFSSQVSLGENASHQLDRLVGLDQIKRRIKELSAWLVYQKSRSLVNKPAQTAPLLHMVFMGNPGTGKTTVARLTGELFHEMGLLKRGHLVEAHAADLVADYVGGTAIKTNQVVDQALDGVLFIDEAYALTAGDRGGFGQEAVDTLLTRLEDDRNRLVVITAGYPERMQKFIQSNPGLRRRFPQENFFDFPDYTPDELWRILRKMLAELAIPIPAGLEDDLKRIIQGMYRDRNEQFGNAGEMRNLAQSIERQRASRIVSDHLPADTPLSRADFPTQALAYLDVELPQVDHFLRELNALTGLVKVKKILTDLYLRLQYDQLRRIADPAYQPDTNLQHMVFTGNPGTGKTTVARLVGQMFKSLGLLRKGHCVEVSRADLVAGFVGQSALKTQEVVKSALDGVLFIDEAYTLSRGGENDFGKEAVDFISQAAVTYRHRLLIIVAGYPGEMAQFLSLNPGLASRFGEPIPFLDYSIAELTEILYHLADRNGFILPDAYRALVGSSIQSMMRRQGSSFGNARAIHQLFEEMRINLARRVVGLHQQGEHLAEEDWKTFRAEDLPYIGFGGDEYPIHSTMANRTVEEPSASLEQIRQEEVEQPVSHLTQRRLSG